MGEIVEFPSDGTTARGYLATPAGGSGIPVIVLQEWWGLVPHVQDVCDRFAAAGFVALAPDLYRGESTTEPDEAGSLMMALNLERAAKDMSGAVATVQEASGREAVGVVGFCMGGGLALVLACNRPDAVKACVPFYGLIPWNGAQPDWSQLDAAVQGHYAERDASFGPDQVAALRDQLQAVGKEADLYVHPGVDHAFFNDTRPEVYDQREADRAWRDTLAFLRAELS
jgi:carboxymethylenebutenolidase